MLEKNQYRERSYVVKLRVYGITEGLVQAENVARYKIKGRQQPRRYSIRRENMQIR